MKPIVSVIILNWNRKDDVCELLKRLKRQTFRNFEIIVVDNASEDSSVAVISRLFPEVRIVQLKKNYALAGFNFGMEVALGKYVVHLASDALPEDDVVEKHVEKLRNNRDLGVSCASTYEWPSKKYLAPNRAKDGDNKRGYQVTYFDGNGICLRREVFEKAGGYSEEYFICLEELEWAVRILRAGFAIRCFTDIVVYNKKAIVGGNYRSRQGFWYCRNWIWFYAQYLPLRSLISFLWLHIGSFFKKTQSVGGTMRKQDCIKGILAGVVGIGYFLSIRRPLSEPLVNRVQEDVFPNERHLYILH